MSRGGKRDGAGRPRKGHKKSLNIRLSIEVVEEIRRRAVSQHKPLGDVVEDAIIKTQHYGEGFDVSSGDNQ